ncbi:hypothetical protein [Alkalihalobacterium alkalinitrilicum]|uniref:hypothetical protein n=1 Tax=Alkalihalobacterium alkalinitrilicum TaxID=427920 RepID=UPI000AF0B113|nr:hypothetical protein [Alkalihalobacterium alkalinitrilicum]
MNTKSVVIGFFIFSITTITMYLVIDYITKWNDGIKVIIALVIGFLLEYLYRKRN